MSINAINRTNTLGNAAQVTTSKSEMPAPVSNPLAAELDAATNQPLPSRFPWLNRFSQQIEAASRLRPPFPAAPVMGDNLNKSA